MRRVVITGIGIISPIGNSATEVEASLRAGRSGIVFAPDYAEHGFRSQVKGQPQIVLHGTLKEWFEARSLAVHLSVTDETDYAASFCVVEKSSP